MKVFIVNQNPNSIYDDVEGEQYQYPKKIPCGRQIDVGDFLVFNLSKKAAVKLHRGDKRSEVELFWGGFSYFKVFFLFL